jgi:CTP synthase (UTP-ammonia lyase)
MTETPPPRLALIGDRSAEVRAHARIPALVAAAPTGAGPADPIEPYWLATTSVAGPEDLDGFDGVWVVPGSPYRAPDGVLTAIRAARLGGIPLLGTCGGFQYLAIEFARDVCGLSDAEHAEAVPQAPRPLIVPLDCSLRGEEETVLVAPGTLAASLMGEGPSTERFFCAYGLDEARTDLLAVYGLVWSARDRTGAVRVAELPGHPFFLGSLFQPELASDPTAVHPLIVGFLDAVRRHASARGAAGALAGSGR